MAISSSENLIAILHEVSKQPVKYFKMPADIISANTHHNFDSNGLESSEYEYLSVLLRDGRLIFMNFLALVFSEHEIGDAGY